MLDCEIVFIFGNVKHIPLNIITLALRENKVNQLKLFVYLKMNSSGILRIDNEYIKANYEALGYKTHKTFKNNLQRLLNDNWVGYNPKTGIYFIRSYKYFGESTKFYFKDEYFKDFRGFLSACVVKKVCNNMMYCKSGAARM